jgi:hypothetical protein
MLTVIELAWVAAILIARFHSLPTGNTCFTQSSLALRFLVNEWKRSRQTLGIYGFSASRVIDELV